MKKFFFTAIASFFFFSSLNGAEATQYPPSFPYSIFRSVSSGIYGLLNTDWKIGALEYCDELGLNCTDIADVITTDTTCDGGTCNIANTGTLDGYEASALLDNTDDQTLSLVTNTLSIENGNSVDLSGYLDNTDTTYTAGGSLLQLVGTTFSVDEGTLTDGNLCSYVSTGTKVQCTTPDSSSNWNTAYSWGNHALAGYLTSYTETDPVYSSSQASNITSTDITNLGNLSGINTGDQDLSGYYSASGGTISGNVSISSNNNLTVDTNTFFVDGIGNNVGIGTTSPTNKLDVSGAQVIGSSYAGIATAPSNGLLVEGNVGIGTNSPDAKLTIQGTTATDLPTYSDELLTVGGWTVGSNWTEVPTGTFTHTTGNTGTLTHNATITSGYRYQVSWTITGRTAGSVNITIGGQSSGTQTGSSSFGPTTTSTASLTITPTSNFDGTISAISLKQITGISSPIFTLKDSSGTTQFELRTGSANYNTFLGLYSGRYNTTGSGNTANGRDSLRSNTTGSNNTANGLESLQYNTTGFGNTANGRDSLRSNTTGYYNTASGYQSLYNNTTGSYNVGTGRYALFSNTTGISNVSIGTNSLYDNTSGSRTIAIGENAGHYQADGSTALTDPENSVYIGYGARGYSNADDNSIVIGYTAVGIGANTAVLGNDSITTTALKGNVGIGTTAPTNKLDVSGGQVIGSSYAGIETAPTNGLLVQGNVGIGTTSPAQKLDVLLADDSAGYISMRNSDGSILIGNGTSTTDNFKPQVTMNSAGTQASTFTVTVPPANDTGTLPVLNFDVRQSDNTTIDTRPTLGISNNGSQIFSVDASGKMGIGLGSTLPAYTLEVGGSVFFNSTSGSTPFYIGRYNSSAEAFRCWVDDNNVNCAIEQDENTGTYGSMQLWLDNDGTSVPYFLVRSKSGTSYFRVDATKANVYGELNVSGVASDGTGKALCVKSDGNIGTCTDAVGASGTCTCS